MTVPDTAPADMAPAEAAGARTRRAVRDIRLVMILNLATIPLSLATNLILGRTAAEVLGWYGAVQVFIGIFNAFLIGGGLSVFSRLVPPMRSDERVSFLLTYGAGLFALLTVVTGVVALVPAAARVLLGPFGNPHWLEAYAVCVAVLAASFATYFLYAVERAPRAVAVLKSVIVGYFLVGLAGATFARATLLRDPAGFIWWSTIAIYTAASALGILFVLGTPEIAARSRVRAWLPRGFWGVVAYVQVGAIVEFAFSHLHPAMVLLWLDVLALSRFHAAMRFVGVLALAPVMLTSVLVPGLAKLEASGLRDEALQQAGAALRACLLLLAPAVFGLIAFAPLAMGFFGADFAPYAYVLRVMAPMVLAGPVVYLGGGMAVAFGAFRGYLWVSTVFVATSVILAWVAIPRWGLVGAAAAATLGSFVQQTAMSYLMRKKMGFRAPFRVHAAWIVAIVIGGVASMVELGPAASFGLWTAGVTAFSWMGAVTIREIRVLATRALRPA